ncbi:unnamed protein product [Enterobius vermicularis]|uniref:Uncharacterized protein n=1 Tax=Enterobius vermicularis TaxID=51028 RepID=A0A0N4VFN4_ENTVE|nr:unnamed protein product [Enterobius vermicularis]
MVGKQKETCLEHFDDGTESLDRREWQQRGTLRGGSSHNIMTASAINSSNAYYQEGPGVAIVDVPTTQQRLVVSFIATIDINNVLEILQFFMMHLSLL